MEFDQSVVLIDAGAGDGRIGKTVREKIHGHTSDLIGVEIDPKQRGGYSFSGWVQESFSSWIDDFEEKLLLSFLIKVVILFLSALLLIPLDYFELLAVLITKYFYLAF